MASGNHGMLDRIIRDAHPHTLCYQDCLGNRYDAHGSRQNVRLYLGDFGL